MLRSTATIYGTKVPTRVIMQQRTTRNQATTPTASAGSLRTRSLYEIGRYSAGSIRLFKD